MKCRSVLAAAGLVLALAVLATAEESLSVDVDELSHAKVCGRGMCCKFSAELQYGVKQKAQHHASSNETKTSKRSGSSIYHFEICSQCGDAQNAFFKLDFTSVEAEDPHVGPSFAKYPVFFRQNHESGKINAVWLSSKDIKKVRRAKRALLKAVAKRIHPGALKKVHKHKHSELDTSDVQTDIELVEEPYISRKSLKKAEEQLFDETSDLISELQDFQNADEITEEDVDLSDLEVSVQQEQTTSYHFYDHDELGDLMLVEHNVAPWGEDGGMVLEEEVSFLDDEDQSHKKPKHAKFKAKNVSTKLHGHHKLRKMVEVKRKKKSRTYMDKHGSVVKSDEKAATKIGSMAPIHMKHKPRVLAPDPGRAKFKVHYKMKREGKPVLHAKCATPVLLEDFEQVVGQSLDGSVTTPLEFIESEDDVVEDQQDTGADDEERLHNVMELLDSSDFDASDLGQHLRSSIVRKTCEEAWARYNKGHLSLLGMKTVLGALAPIRGHTAASELLETLWNKDAHHDLRTQAAVSLALRGPEGSDLDVPEFLLDGVADIAFSKDTEDRMRDPSVMALGALLRDHANAGPYLERITNELASTDMGRHQAVDMLEDISSEIGSERSRRSVALMLALANAGPSAQEAAPHVARFLKSRNSKEVDAATTALANMEVQIGVEGSALPALEAHAKTVLTTDFATYTPALAYKDDYGMAIKPKVPLLTYMEGITAHAIFDAVTDEKNDCKPDTMTETCVFASCRARRDAAITKCYIGRLRSPAIGTFSKKAEEVYEDGLGKPSDPKPQGVLRFDPSQMTLKELRQRRMSLEGYSSRLDEVTEQYLWAFWVLENIRYIQTDPERKAVLDAVMKDPQSTYYPPGTPASAKKAIQASDIDALAATVANLKATRDKVTAVAKPLVAAFEAQWKKTQEHEMAKESGTMVEYSSCSVVNSVPWVDVKKTKTLKTRTSSYWNGIASCRSRTLNNPTFPPSTEKEFRALVPIGDTDASTWANSPVMTRDLVATWREVTDAIYQCVGDASAEVLKKLEAAPTTPMAWSQQYEYQHFYDEAVNFLNEADDFYVAHYRFQCAYTAFAASLPAGKDKEAANAVVTKAMDYWKAIIVKREAIGPQYQYFSTPTLSGIAGKLTTIRDVAETATMALTEQRWDYSTCSSGLVTRTTWTGTPPGTEDSGEGLDLFNELKKIVDAAVKTCVADGMKAGGPEAVEAQITYRCQDYYWAQTFANSNYGTWAGEIRGTIDAVNCEYDNLNYAITDHVHARAQVVKILDAWQNKGLEPLSKVDSKFSALKRVQCAWGYARSQYEYYYDKDQKLSKAREAMASASEKEGAAALKGSEEESAHAEAGGLQGDADKRSATCVKKTTPITLNAGQLVKDDMLSTLPLYLELDGFIASIVTLRDTARNNGGAFRNVLETTLQNIAPYDRFTDDDDDEGLHALGIKNPWILRTKSGEYGAKIKAGWGQPANVQEAMTSDELVAWYDMLARPDKLLKAAWSKMSDAMKTKKAEQHPPDWGNVQMYQGDVGLKAAMRSKKLHIFNIRGSLGFKEQPESPSSAAFGVEYTFSVFGIQISHARKTHPSNNPDSEVCVGVAPIGGEHNNGVNVDGGRMQAAIGIKHVTEAAWNFPLGCWYGIFIHVKLAASATVGLQFFFQTHNICLGKKIVGTNLVDKKGDAAVLGGLDGFGKTKFDIECSADFWGVAEIYVQGAVVVFESHVTAYTTTLVEIRRLAKLDITTQPLSLDITIGLRPGAIVKKLMQGYSWLKREHRAPIRMEKKWKYRIPSYPWGAVMFDSGWKPKSKAGPPLIGVTCAMAAEMATTDISMLEDEDLASIVADLDNADKDAMTEVALDLGLDEMGAGLTTYNAQTKTVVCGPGPTRAPAEEEDQPTGQFGVLGKHMKNMHAIGSKVIDAHTKMTQGELDALLAAEAKAAAEAAVAKSAIAASLKDKADQALNMVDKAKKVASVGVGPQAMENLDMDEHLAKIIAAVNEQVEDAKKNIEQTLKEDDAALDNRVEQQKSAISQFASDAKANMMKLTTKEGRHQVFQAFTQRLHDFTSGFTTSLGSWVNRRDSDFDREAEAAVEAVRAASASHEAKVESKTAAESAVKTVQQRDQEVKVDSAKAKADAAKAEEAKKTEEAAVAANNSPPPPAPAEPDVAVVTPEGQPGLADKIQVRRDAEAQAEIMAQAPKDAANKQREDSQRGRDQLMAEAKRTRDTLRTANSDTAETTRKAARRTYADVAKAGAAAEEETRRTARQGNGAARRAAGRAAEATEQEAAAARAAGRRSEKRQAEVKDENRRAERRSEKETEESIQKLVTEGQEEKVKKAIRRAGERQREEEENVKAEMQRGEKRRRERRLRDKARKDASEVESKLRQDALDKKQKAEFQRSRNQLRREEEAKKEAERMASLEASMLRNSDAEKESRRDAEKIQEELREQSDADAERERIKRVESSVEETIKEEAKQADSVNKLIKTVHKAEEKGLEAQSRADKSVNKLMDRQQEREEVREQGSKVREMVRSIEEKEKAASEATRTHEMLHKGFSEGRAVTRDAAKEVAQATEEQAEEEKKENDVKNLEKKVQEESAEATKKEEKEASRVAEEVKESKEEEAKAEEAQQLGKQLDENRRDSRKQAERTEASTRRAERRSRKQQRKLARKQAKAARRRMKRLRRRERRKAKRQAAAAKRAERLQKATDAKVAEEAEKTADAQKLSSEVKELANAQNDNTKEVQGRITRVNDRTSKEVTESDKAIADRMQRMDNRVSPS